MTDSIMLTDIEVDAIGEISNMCMGTAATTLSTIFGKKVAITTPKVTSSNWEILSGEHGEEFVCVKVSYTQGIEGSNLLLLDKNDAISISNIMIMGDSTELTELELSAVGEAANQMIGSSSTSLATLVGELIDIDPPVVSLINKDTAPNFPADDPFLSGEFVQVRFKLEIEGLVDSYLLQLFPYEFAKKLCECFDVDLSGLGNDTSGGADSMMGETNKNISNADSDPRVSEIMELNGPQVDKVVEQTMNTQQVMPNMAMPNGMNPNGMMPNMMQGNPNMNNGGMPFDMGINNINVQQAQFTSFIGGNNNLASQPENIDLIMDVPLEVTVELGRTNKSISEILEFKPGTIVELNKASGAPIDVLVNGKLVARGEVVVIDENFGIRIVDIIK